MTAKKKMGLIISLVLIVTLIGIVVKNEFANDQTFNALIKKEDGTEQIAYETKLVRFDKSETTLEDYKGKILVLNFWASWCGPCINEAPDLNEFYKKKPKNVEFLAINMTSKEKGVESVEKFADQYNIKFPIFLDEKGLLLKSFEIMGYPTTIIIDTDGVVQYRVQGEVNQDELNELVSQL
ncbi:TlpA family protein disulfide reductase [Lysinibacillus sp. NPDC097287]|uniref:TlpA family protein disulfide reductase n=1 Tax=Lysinibacillus sp. NPDC097287 TaxID=3364144 RepID=UPI003817687C